MPAKRSRDLSTTCGLLIEAASYLQRGMHDDVERATGLSGAWLEVLLRLHRTPGGAMRINEIAAQVTLPASSFSRLADRMEEEGLVERHPDPRHRRATLLHVTSAVEYQRHLVNALELSHWNLGASEHEAVFVYCQLTIEPLGARCCADKDEQPTHSEG